MTTRHWLLRHPVVVLFSLALVLTLWQRLSKWWGQGGHILPRHLHQTITIVAVAGPGEPTDPYVTLLRSAAWPSRISLRLFKMLGPQEQAADAPSGLHHGSVRLTNRYGAFDPANERMRLLREPKGSEYVLLLAQPVEAVGGWDDLLLRMWKQCKAPTSSHAVLTTMPPAAQVSGDVSGTFVCAAKDGTLHARPFATPTERPQPGVFASARMCFGPTTLVAECAPRYGVNASNEDMVLSQALWTQGANFFAPHASLFHAISQPTPAAVRKLDGEWEPTSSAVRTAREWALFSGKRASDKWSRRAQLGLTPTASHEERFAKHGDALELHGL